MSKDTYDVLHNEGRGWRAVPTTPPPPPPTAKRRPATVRVARWSAEHPWRAIAAWVLFVLLATVGGGMVGNKQIVDDSNPRTDSGRADRIVTSGHFQDAAVENVLFTTRSGALDAGTAKAATAEVTSKMKALAQVGSVEPSVTSKDGKAVIVAVRMAGDPDTASDRVDRLQAVTAQVQTDFPQLRVEEVGDASLDKAISAALG